MPSDILGNVNSWPLALALSKCHDLVIGHVANLYDRGVFDNLAIEGLPALPARATMAAQATVQLACLRDGDAQAIQMLPA